MAEHLTWTLNQGKQLKMARRARGFTQAQLAVAVSGDVSSPLTQTIISKVERGDQPRPPEPFVAPLLDFIDSAGVASELPAMAPPTSEASDSPIETSDAAGTLSRQQREDLRHALSVELPKQVGSVTRESLKLVRQLSVWAGLPLSELQDDLSDIFQGE